MDEDVIVGGKYLMGRKIGSGSFGSIILGTDIETAKFVAIKFVSQINKWIGKTRNERTSITSV